MKSPDPLIRRSTRRRAILAGAFSLAAGLALLLSACGASSTSVGGTGGAASATATSTVTCADSATVASWHLITPGTLTIASDTTYAPAEFADPNNPNNYIGYDMDLAREIARRLCLKADIVKADFSTIIPNLTGPALGQQRYDMSISSFTINSDRQAKVNMIPYFTAGESILVPQGNPKNIKTFADMCGKVIAVQDGTVEKDEVEDANGTGPGTSGQAPICKSNPIKIVHFADQNVVIQQVITGAADASYQDSPVTSYFVSQHPGKLEVGGITVSPSPQGLVMRKDNPNLQTAVTNALNSMRSDGTYLAILKKWGQQAGAYPPLK